MVNITRRRVILKFEEPSDAAKLCGRARPIINLPGTCRARNDIAKFDESEHPRDKDGKFKDKPKVRHIKSPIEPNPAKGSPAAVSYLIAGLNGRQKRLLEKLPKYGNCAIIHKRQASMKDLAALTAHTGDEFAMFTKGKKRLVMRGDNKSTPIYPKDAKKLNKMGFKWSGHTHPGDSKVVLTPSGGDRLIARCFKQSTFVIYNGVGQFDMFKEKTYEEK